MAKECKYIEMLSLWALKSLYRFTIIIIKAIGSFHCTNISFEILSFSVHKLLALSAGF